MNKIFKNYPWLNISYKFIKQFFYKNKYIDFNILFYAKYGSVENRLIWYLTRALLCTSFNPIKEKFCGKCDSCKLIKYNNSHPDLYILIIKKFDNFNNNKMEYLLNFIYNLPVFSKKKIILIFFEKDTIDYKSIYLLNHFINIIYTDYSYIKIILKFHTKFYNYLFQDFIHIHIFPPSENMCRLWLKQHYSNLLYKYNDIDIITVLRLNKNILNHTIYFLKYIWYLYIKFSNEFFINIQNNTWYYLIKLILNDIKNCKLYLKFIIEFILDIFKKLLLIQNKYLTNYKYSHMINNQLNNKLLILNIKYLYYFYEDINTCYYKLITYHIMNNEIMLLELYIKWKKECCKFV